MCRHGPVIANCTDSEDFPQHLKAFLCRSVHSHLFPPELSDLTERVEAADDKLFRLILKDNHILSSLLGLKSDNRYNLRRNVITENYYRKTLGKSSESVQSTC